MLESTAAIVAFVLLSVFVLAMEAVTHKRYSVVGKVLNVATSLIILLLLFMQLWWPYMVFVLVALPLLYWLPLKKTDSKKVSFAKAMMALVAALAVYYAVFGLLHLLNQF